MNMITTLTRPCLLIMIALTASVVSMAQVPQTVALQGQLFQSTGSPVPDGRYTVSVAFHDGINGSPIVVCDACPVEFRRGIFQLVVGGADAPLPPMDKQYWVSVRVGDEELYPRMPLHAVPFALAAKTAEHTPGAVPVGGLVPYAGTTAPEGTSFLPADGRAVSASEYPELFAAIGTTYGDGSTDVLPQTNFNLPDTRNVFVKGAKDDNAERTFSDPINTETVRLDNNARGSVLDPGVMSNHELVAALPSVSFMFLIRVK
jgi:hypothetical protein